MEAVRMTGLLLSVACLMSHTTGVPSTPSTPSSSDCTYMSLLNHLGLINTNVTLQAIRPVKNWTTSTIVWLDMLIFGILEVDEKLQTVTNHIWLSISWENEFLAWNPADFCGISMISVLRSNLWLPDIGIQEDTTDTSSVHVGQFVNVYPNGTIRTELRQKLTYTCQLNLLMFPFDRQNCKITFLSHSANSNTLLLGTLFNDTKLSTLSDRIVITRGEWSLIDIQTKYCLISPNHTDKCKLTYEVCFERKPLLYVINFIIPLFYLLILDLTSFFISEARGEKMSFKITILLSISVLLLILKDLLPSTEDNLPHIASYCIGIFALVGISVLESMLVTFLVDLDNYCGAIKNQKEEEEEEDHPLEVEYFKSAVFPLRVDGVG
ncbi:5-hydroxytryptamine receptor 3A isoform X2 [Gouania willdenowi]|uniref:5-hydroxytryptamine receptor 3A isoform X2 n=1 Tax=Gouania willdenowi TaxID=441366 RepID=UPI0010560D00|nr:5-hydroxytryptamine receptor 3A-like isoform X2 [Gouania willdenowi]